MLVDLSKVFECLRHRLCCVNCHRKSVQYHYYANYDLRSFGCSIQEVASSLKVKLERLQNGLETNANKSDKFQVIAFGLKSTIGHMCYSINGNKAEIS